MATRLKHNQSASILVVAFLAGAAIVALAAEQSAASSTEGAPVSGRSGSAPAAAVVSGGNPKQCSLLLLHLDVDILETPTAYFGDRVRIEPFLDYCSAASTTVGVTVNGSPLNLPLHDSTNLFSTTPQFDPCSLGASDLPGTKLNVVAKTQGQYGGLTHGGTITLDKDTLAPAIEVHSTPRKGQKVKAGDQIEVRVSAKEQRSYGPWQTGIQTIKVNAQRALVGTWTNPSAQPLACAQKTWEQQYTATYTVPADPPSSIHLCAMVQDYAGNTDMKCADFPTDQPQRALWVGTVNGEKTVTYVQGPREPNPGQHVVHHYTTKDHLRLREGPWRGIRAPDSKRPFFRIVGYEVDMKNERSTATATYTGSSCTGQSSTTSTTDQPTGHIWYKTVSDPVTYEGGDIPSDGIYQIWFGTWGKWTACPGNGDYGLGYGLGVEPITIGSGTRSFTTLPAASKQPLLDESSDLEVRHLTDRRTHLVGSFASDSPLPNGGHTDIHVSWDICREGSRGCITTR